VRIQALDRVGLLRDVTTVLADEKVNLISVHTNKMPSLATSTVIMTLDVTGVDQLYHVMGRLSTVRGVYEVTRDTGQE
jgi:(p)ppGpp synthase/HD superfamily hydrolase